jgi:D-sedoheptulose 7-phosphate isomerase
MYVHDLKEHLRCFEKLHALEQPITAAGETLAAAVGNGRKVLVCGNGGSAADSQHFAAELVGRFEAERRGAPAVALTTDTSILTAVGNDYGFDAVFARQVEALGRQGDALVAISTSGNSTNVLQAVLKAKRLGIGTVGLLGKEGGTIAGAVDHPIVVAHGRTARIQEAHLFVLHFWAGLIEEQIGD